MKYFVWTAVLWVMAFVTIGCSTGNEQAGQPVPISTEYKGLQGSFPDQGFFVIQRPETWRALWEGRQAPAVDFTQNSALVTLMGRQPTAGYNITITDVRTIGTDIVATVSETRPKRGEAVAQVITYPYHMVVVPKVTQQVVFRIKGVEIQPVTIQDLYTGQQSQAVEPRMQVIRDAVAWQTFWTNTIGGAEPAPQIDFTRYMAAVVLLGRKPTAGYAVTITGVSDVSDRLEVRYRAAAPAPDAVVARVITSPYAIAVLPASPQAVAFRTVMTVLVRAD